ncbi:hypothetical protein SALBM311S_08127 [Streptomyces alboniger]
MFSQSIPMITSLDRMENRRLARKLARVAATLVAVEPQLREVSVMFERTYAGLDVHARSVVGAAIDGVSGEIRWRRPMRPDRPGSG